MEAPALQLNCSHPAEFEFDVQVQGLNPDVVPDVRFIISLPLYSLCFACFRLAPTKWKAMIPALPDVFTEVSYPFAVEVIADGYHFQPAAGTIVVISNPKVAVGQRRPTAAASAVTPAPAPEPVPEPVPEAPSVTATLIQQVQQETPAEPTLPVVTEAEIEEAALAWAEEVDEPLPVERVVVAAPAVAEEVPVKPKLSIFKLKKLGQVTR